MTLYLTDLNADMQAKPVIGPSPLYRPAPTGVYRAIFKRMLDLALVVLTAPFTVPLILVLALLVATDGHRPFYTQQRVGRNGKPFQLWKLRTMVPDADRILEAYLARNPAARLEWDATQKLKHDPRITRVGRFLRKTSLDELPQLINVLNGTMSLVGPRPMMVEQKVFYPGTAYYNLRPGITGLWQISDRNECDFVGRAPYDEHYFRILSFRTDLGVLFRTVAVVLRGTGY
ncbi:sugar transferase [Rhodovulum marinum]|uniref:Lipopolysaccharide/colanic/teichoic acid biosynthesis glycosyltransferase n=1 Tax=Rhodovulum marinum TaxID=320662 RepID=A0A4R2PZA6_9RHOB|nr:sugar transferase [Rhodovulum marinum]TCP39561.1 lipopolysaccharide/colanic/teichoic acid biosynthesis glycosyltransferase [Rhodovulum marinum]